MARTRHRDVAQQAPLGELPGAALRAVFLFMRRMAEVTEARATAGNAALPAPLPAGVVAYEISGPLFFGAAQKAMATLGDVAAQAKAVILLLDEAHAMAGQ
jgi:SulP family sulfate permease